jgi:hypothetical protein
MEQPNECELRAQGPEKRATTPANTPAHATPNRHYKSEPTPQATIHLQRNLSRPGLSGDFIRWKDEVHGTSVVLPVGVPSARGPDGR